MSEHRGMAEKLVDNVGLRGIKRLRVMSDILGRMENSEGKTIQELSLGQQSTDRFQAPSRL
jgi:hypothetical protein